MVPRTCTAASNLFRRTKEGVAAETIQGLLRGELQSIALAVGRRADSNRLPLLQLRVITQALQVVARACKSRISKRLSLLRFAPGCAVLRSRWYQSGIRSPRITRRQSLCTRRAGNEW